MHSQVHRAHGEPVQGRRPFGWKLWNRLPSWLVESLPGMVIAALLLAPYLSYPLLWDGGWYYECVKNAAHTPFNFHNFLCFEHPSFLFIGIFTVPEYLMPGSVMSVHVTVLIMHLLSVVAFGAICQKIFRHAHASTRVLGTLLYAIQPVILANATSLHVDIGVTYALVIFLAFLVHERHEWAAASGILLCFTKETGVLLYVLAVAAHWLFTVRPHHRSTAHALRAAWGRAFYLLPPVLFGLYSASGMAFFEGRDTASVLHVLTTFSLLDPRFLHMLAEILLFQFTWLQTGVLITALLLWFVRWDKGEQRAFSHDTSLLWFLAVFYALGVYVLTRYTPFSNLRYLMAIFPVGTLLFIASASYVLRRKLPLNLLLSVAVILQLVAVFASVDPVSQKIFGTFRVGSRTLYPLGNQDLPDCCSFGRDQLVYNLQHLKMVALQDEVFARLRPTKDTIIAQNTLAWYGFTEGFDPRTYRRRNGPGVVIPRYMTPSAIVSMPNPPKEVWYVAYPFLANDKDEMAILRQRYAWVETAFAAGGGYAVPLYRYMLRY